MNTMQEEFDAVVAHLFRQGRPAERGNTCLYRAGELSCAVGCRIPDNVYTPEMDIPKSAEEGTGIENLVKNFRDVLPKEIILYKNMFSQLQSVHDNYGNRIYSTNTFVIERLADQLAGVAAQFGLKFTKPQ